MNYFEYFTEIEDRFNARRGSLLMLSTLDWALIETWREAGVPLAAVLRGIDDAFDKHDARRARASTRLRKVNGLAWCAQAVMTATEEMREAAIGTDTATPPTPRESGLESERVAAFLEANAHAIDEAKAASADASWAGMTAGRLRELAASMRSAQPMPLDDLDRTLTVLEEQMLHALANTAPAEQVVQLRAEADRDLSAFRGKLNTEQLRSIRQQYLTRKLTQLYRLPRLSLFYMSVGE